MRNIDIDIGLLRSNSVAMANLCRLYNNMEKKIQITL
jgi:hypothetical protein